MIIVMARQNAKNGGCLVDIEVEPSWLKGSPSSGFEWTSKLPNLPKAIKQNYRMIYVPTEYM